jgi:hypothetical protein
MTVGFYGALYQYLRTGEGPQEMKDYFYPETGEVDADGNPERVQIASYMKDFFAYAGHPWETVKHKMNPIVDRVRNASERGLLRRHDPESRRSVRSADRTGSGLCREAGTALQLPEMSEQSKRGDRSNVTKARQLVRDHAGAALEVRTEAQNRMMEFLAQRK